MSKVNTKGSRYLYGHVRPKRGPYPKGVFNGPNPRTERGKRRRKENTANIPEELIDTPK